MERMKEGMVMEIIVQTEEGTTTYSIVDCMWTKVGTTYSEKEASHTGYSGVDWADGAGVVDK